MLKKSIIFLGAVLTILMMASTVIAVPHYGSEKLLDILKNDEKNQKLDLESFSEKKLDTTKIKELLTELKDKIGNLDEILNNIKSTGSPLFMFIPFVVAGIVGILGVASYFTVIVPVIAFIVGFLATYTMSIAELGFILSIPVSVFMGGVAAIAYPFILAELAFMGTLAIIASLLPVA